MPDDTHAESQTYDPATGQVTTKSIQGRALDPSGALAVQQRMAGTSLAAAAAANKAKQAAQAGGKPTQAEVQKKALAPRPTAEDKSKD